jgi:hypothetical protein
MTRGGSPHRYLLVAAMCMTSAARAGVWVSEPVLGLAADYSTNPALLFVNHNTETHGDILIDAPTTYHANGASFSVLPSFRLSDSPGFSSLASNYAHLTAAGEIDSDRDTLTVTGQYALDSSLYQFGFNGFSGSTGVRRETSLGDANWVHALTERVNVGLELDSSHVLYGQATSFLGLIDYRYTSAAPSLSWATSERTTLTVLGSIGLYNSSNGETKSVNSNLEIGFTRRFNELWTVTAKAGLSRETDTLDEYYGPYLLETLRSTTNGTVFTANVTRQGSRLSANASASRSLVPSGYAFLSHQDTYALSLQCPWTERLTLGGQAQRVTSVEEQNFGGPVNQTYFNLGLSAAWKWTEKWTVTLSTSKITVKYAPTIDAATTGVNLQLSRHFDPIKWQ